MLESKKINIDRKNKKQMIIYYRIATPATAVDFHLGSPEHIQWVHINLCQDHKIKVKFAIKERSEEYKSSWNVLREMLIEKTKKS